MGEKIDEIFKLNMLNRQIRMLLKVEIYGKPHFPYITIAKTLNCPIELVEKVAKEHELER